MQADEVYAAASVEAWHTAKQTHEAALTAAEEAQKKLNAANAAAKAKPKDKKAKHAAAAAKMDATEAQKEVLSTEDALKVATQAATKANPLIAVLAAKDAEGEAIKAEENVAVQNKAVATAVAKVKKLGKPRWPFIYTKKAKHAIAVVEELRQSFSEAVAVAKEKNLIEHQLLFEAARAQRIQKKAEAAIAAHDRAAGDATGEAKQSQKLKRARLSHDLLEEDTQARSGLGREDLLQGSWPTVELQA